MSNGQRGEIYEVNGDQVAVLFDVCEKQTTEVEKDEKPKAQDVKPSIYWIPGMYSSSGLQWKSYSFSTEKKEDKIVWVWTVWITCGF